MDRLDNTDRSDAARFAQDRTMDLNEANIRKMFRMQYQDPLHIDAELIPHNMDYKWVRDTIFGDPSLSKVSSEKRMGWTPVPAQNHPEMMPSFDGRKHHLDGYIHVKGLILCQRPKQIGDVQRQLEAEACYANMQSIPGIDGNSPVKVQVLRNDVGISKMQSFKDE